MDALRDYILSVIGGALVCGIVMSLVPKGYFSEIGKFLTGLFLTVSLLQPLSELDLSSLSARFLQPQDQSGEAIAALGKEASQNLLAARIKQEAEAYILDKAASLDASVTAEVILSGGDIPVPTQITLVGSVDAAAKTRLEQIILQDLGIAKENQLWIQESSGNG